MSLVEHDKRDFIETIRELRKGMYYNFRCPHGQENDLGPLREKIKEIYECTKGCAEEVRESFLFHFLKIMISDINFDRRFLSWSVTSAMDFLNELEEL